MKVYLIAIKSQKNQKKNTKLKPSVEQRITFM